MGLVISKDILPTLEFYLKAIGGIGGFTIFVIGYRRYYKDQIWKRNEFVAAQIKEFLADSQVINTMYMLDWGRRKIQLFPDEPVYAERFAMVTRNTLNSALQSHRIKFSFNKVEVAIRDDFDKFLAYFEMYERFINRKLITENEIEPYLRYWVSTISDDIEEPVRTTIHYYLAEYGYQGVQNLFMRFGKDIAPKEPLFLVPFNEKEESVEISGLATEDLIEKSGNIPG
jgi:hypothetical protein